MQQNRFNVTRLPGGEGERAAKARAVEAAWQRQHAKPAASDPVRRAYAGTVYRGEHRAARWVWLALMIILGALGYGYARGQTIGLHIATAHDRGGYRSDTPGMYIRLDSGAGLGFVRNSLGAISWHADWTVQTAPLWAGVRLGATAGFITGYDVPHMRATRQIPPGPAVQPFVMPSILLAERHRIIYIPKKPDEPHSAQAVSYAVEFKGDWL